MPQTVFDDTYKDGVRISRVERIVSDADLERDDAAPRLIQALALLRLWSADAQDAAALGAMTVQQRIQRQAVIETRVAASARLLLAMARQQGID